MYEMCIKHYKYSEGQTQRRLSSARLLRELPEIEERIQSGDLNITNLAKVQSFVRAEKQTQHNLSRSEKLDLVASIENKSTRQVEQELIKKSTQPEILMSSFGVSGGALDHHVKFEAWMNAETQELLSEFKNLCAHELTDASSVSILKLLLQKALKEKKKKLGLNPENDASLPSAPKVSQAKKIRMAIPAKIKRHLWQRAHARCEHHTQGVRCESTHALQMDHVRPVALGGGNELGNLQLLCRGHNSRRGVKTFGPHFETC